MQTCLLVIIGEFLVVATFLEWWLVPTTADHCGHIPEYSNVCVCVCPCVSVTSKALLELNISLCTHCISDTLMLSFEINIGTADFDHLDMITHHW